jgi:hypothetical protein
MYIPLMYVHTYFDNYAIMLVFNWFSFATRLVIEFTSNVSTSACAHAAGYGIINFDLVEIEQQIADVEGRLGALIGSIYFGFT